MGVIRVGIVGAGPAGVMAALEAARLGAQVLLFDTNETIGRKLLVTGNGRCNISNRLATAADYACDDRAWLAACLAAFGPRETALRMAELGIPTTATPDGWSYPLSDSAATVVDALTASLELAGVSPLLKTKIADIQTRPNGLFLVAGGGEHGYVVDRAIVACGGKAYPALGSRGQLLPVLERLGHTIAPVRPALVPITAEVQRWHKWQGVRLDAGLSLWQCGHQVAQTVGNLMFTQFGLSGPAAMNLSHLVPEQPAGLELEIDLLARYGDPLSDLLQRLAGTRYPLATALGAVLPAKLPLLLLELAQVPGAARLCELDQEALQRLLYTMRHLRCRVTGTRGFNYAQVSTGGVPISEVEALTMASRRVPGLYLAGEVLDVIGPCGGYNLQWAWTSGALAGRAGAASTS
jgi:hypothetical protein